VEKIADILMQFDNDNDTDLNDMDTWGYSAMTHACNTPYPMIIRRLVEKQGALVVNTRDASMMTPLHHLCNCAKTKSDYSCIEWMVCDADADVNAQDEYGYTPMMILLSRMCCSQEMETQRNYYRDCVIDDDDCVLEDSFLARIFRTTNVNVHVTTVHGDGLTTFMSPCIKAWFEHEMNTFSYVLK